ncbi:thiocillin family RiPP [Nonomuraea jabiensis]|uniref:Putative thiazole/oxazole-modified microcin (TOMM)-like peptide n=1 Tax=Nonomuraea jabiensis TaxID=882448 RepID=A0A7W9G7V1_9ACTN|nr:thiocillin family RiPP [Nonomuraea jabiensis]MBB5778818.1 putative thiazole/oxazole-modified microcin (TOMM)-like peptide [Nonomuraea jabiensis]
MAESLYILGDEDRKKFARLIAAAWSEEDVKSRYGREPRQMLAEYGIAYPEGVATPPLPPKPAGEFSIEELEVAAGTEAPADGCFGSASSVSCFTGCVATASTYGCAGAAEA